LSFSSIRSTSAGSMRARMSSAQKRSSAQGVHFTASFAVISIACAPGSA